MMQKRFVHIAFFVLLALLALADAAWACPTCKDNLAPDGHLTGMARGYAYSIVFMLSMPPLIFGGLSAYFYWEVRKARRTQQTNTASQVAGTEYLSTEY